ncbi:hypothetical protein QBC37DRAFT_11268 [Rhypophila decipiens]|uniref:Uncharacterized protein n=1 Tax=Rhypophila decipiens TaxID=261697 RepID=A0AAN6Y2V7_9PEZI|nr:hypothetical protein QBC37DRAFT_11268 [Rhypophila decipiens]
MMSPSAVAGGTPSPELDTTSVPPPQAGHGVLGVVSSSSKLTSTSTPAPATQQRYSLVQLPTELLYPIAAHLVPEPPLTTRFALRSTGTWEFRDVAHQWVDWLASHHNLLSFAMTCRRMAAIANPLLYHTLVLRDHKSLITLYQRMTRRPEIRGWIKSINCFANLAGHLTINNALEEWQQRMKLPWHPKDPRRPDLDDLIPDRIITFELFRTIVLCLPSLCDVHIAFPDPDPTDFLDDRLREGVMHCLTVPDSYNSDDLCLPRYFPFQMLQHLSSLRIYCHREDGDREATFPRVLSDYAITCLPDLKCLKTLELCCSSGGNMNLLQDITLPPLPQIENLRLYGSHIHEPRLVAFCLACINLQNLLVHFEASSTDEDRDELPEGKTLNDALTGLSKTLRTLELVALSDGHYLTRGMERPRKPENHRLTCIPQLEKLESLTLDYRGVFGTLGILEEDDGERLCQLLPASLKHFTMICEWGTAKDWKQSYLANLDMILYGVQCLCANRSPRLSTIFLQIHSWPAKSRFHRRFNREVEMARQRCARAGILFKTYDIMPRYQDEDEMDEVEEDDFEDEDEAEVMEDEFDDLDEEDELELEEEDEASEYYFSGDDELDPEREARRPPNFDAFVQSLPEDHGVSLDELFYAYHEDRWDEYLF